MMDANLILIDDDTELARARALVETLWDSEAPADVARLRARALLIAAYEESRWPPRPPSPAELIRQLGSTRPVPRRYGPVSRDAEPSERGSERQEGPQPDDGARLRARFSVPADLLLPAPETTKSLAAAGRAAA